MGNFESLLFIQYISEYDYNYKDNINNYYDKNNNYYDKNNIIEKKNKLENINKCYICNKNLRYKTIYRCNDLSFCCIKHRDLI